MRAFIRDCHRFPVFGRYPTDVSRSVIRQRPLAHLVSHLCARMQRMKALTPTDLKTILHSKRANVYYLEHCRVLGRR